MQTKVVEYGVGSNNRSEMIETLLTAYLGILHTTRSSHGKICVIFWTNCAVCQGISGFRCVTMVRPLLPSTCCRLTQATVLRSSTGGTGMNQACQRLYPYRLEFLSRKHL